MSTLYGRMHMNIKPVYELILPVPPSRGNARGSWRKHERERNTYYAQCDRAVINDQMKNRTDLPFKHAVWHAIFHVNRPMDFDNLVARLKWPIDYLKDRGWIVDDGPKHLWPYALPAQYTETKKHQRLIIYLKHE